MAISSPPDLYINVTSALVAQDPPMKRTRETNDELESTFTARASAKKSKSIQACTSCRKHKTRCEILDRSKSPVRCHRCQVLTLQCSYEETMAPTTSTSTTVTPEDTALTTVKTGMQAAGAYPSNLPPTDRLWAFVSEDYSEIDWSAPMLAIQQLSKMPLIHSNTPSPPPFVFPPGEVTLAKILPDEQIGYLLDLFDEQYTPWINFKLARSTNSTLLDIVCCAIASRHLDNGPANIQVKMMLQKLTEDSIAKTIFNPRSSESVETIQALLILSLWEPVGGPNETEERRDGRLLIASAVSMAMNLRLNKASLKAAAFKSRHGGRLSAEHAKDLEEMLDNARLVAARLCLGTGRVPLSRRSAEDQQLIVFPKSLEGVLEYGDIRLGLAASAFDHVEEGISIRLQTGMDIGDWHDRTMVILEKLKRLKRLIVPLPYVLEHHQFYFHMMHIYEGIARLLILYYALWDARMSVGHVPFGASWHPYFKPHGREVVGMWARDMSITTEGFLVNVIAADMRLLRTAPDNIFTMIALAAGYLVGVKFLLFRGGTELPGGSDLVLAKIVEHVACVPGYAAQRAALLVRGMIAKWENRNNKDLNSAHSNSNNSRPPAPTTTGTPPPGAASSYPTPTSDHLIDHAAPTTSGSTPNSDFLELSAFTQPSSIPEIDLNMFMDTITLDAEFWNNLALQTQPLPEFE
ncbi:hypothetical protein GGX14DRAFT_442325 [Mycena pura]|uniref:Zn(2)-C6 fungal-type domain-containing protein n=1 Tax=Mycena pura TaxID=153505 RepID=A0AAD6VLQ1_9AGAR|nr:hypothetical protein GGX14DRAFT_442325 [Mycena pura]